MASFERVITAALYRRQAVVYHQTKTWFDTHGTLVNVEATCIHLKIT